MTHHVVQKIQLVVPLKAKPEFIPNSRPRGTKARGLAYERKIGKLLSKQFPDLQSNAWFEFIDLRKKNYCCIDHYVVLPSQILLFECKLTETFVAFSQIDFLYRPILKHLYGKPVTGVQICKYVTGQTTGRRIDHLEEALPYPGSNFTWHCLGR